MSTEVLDLAAIKAEHSPEVMFEGTPHEFQVCSADHGGHWPCLPYLLAAELFEVRAQLAATEAKIARVESVRRYKVDGETWVCNAADVDRALRSSVSARLREEA